MGVLKHQANEARQTLSARVVVGRAPGCLLRLDDPAVSAEHASIFWTGERWEIRDLGSSNGTFVDGRRASPGERIALQEGVVLSFAGQAERWVLVDPLPPVASARRRGTGEVRVAQDGLLALPSPEDPQISIFENEAGRWLVEAGGPARSGIDEEELSCDGACWILSVPPPSPGGVVPTTRRDRGLPRTIGVLTLVFYVSRDREYVKLELVQGRDTVPLGDRVHHELLLMLARARLEARDDPSMQESEKGWLYLDDLATMMGVQAEHLSVIIHRARQQLAEAGVLNAGSIVERRPSTRQIRLSTDRVEIRPI